LKSFFPNEELAVGVFLKIIIDTAANRYFKSQSPIPIKRELANIKIINV
jgi:hypothetical protein